MNLKSFRLDYLLNLIICQLSIAATWTSDCRLLAFDREAEVLSDAFGVEAVLFLRA